MDVFIYYVIIAVIFRNMKYVMIMTNQTLVVEKRLYIYEPNQRLGTLYSIAHEILLIH